MEFSKACLVIGRCIGIQMVMRGEISEVLKVACPAVNALLQW
jgi:hypothetical protein